MILSKLMSAMSHRPSNVAESAASGSDRSAPGHRDGYGPAAHDGCRPMSAPTNINRR